MNRRDFLRVLELLIDKSPAEWRFTSVFERLIHAIFFVPLMVLWSFFFLAVGVVGGLCYGAVNYVLYGKDA